jgi:hypothetical protein
MKRSEARYCTTLCAAVTVDVCFHDDDSYCSCFYLALSPSLMEGSPSTLLPTVAIVLRCV